MPDSSTFLGESPAYWLELRKHAHTLGSVELLREIAELRAKVSFYESRLEEIAKFRGAMGSPFKEPV